MQPSCRAVAITRPRSPMLKSQPLPIDRIRVPVKRVKTLEPEKVTELAEAIRPDK